MNGRDARRAAEFALDLTTLPILTTARACRLADCHPSTLRRSPLVPIGRRGKVLTWRTADVLAWLRGEFGPAPSPTMTARPTPVRRDATPTDALERIAKLARTGA